jgi:exopolysaccharide biosynthesis protein
MTDLWSESQCMNAVVLDPGPCSVMGETSNSISDAGQRVRHFQKGVNGLQCRSDILS